MMPPVPAPPPASGGLQPEASFDDGCAPNPSHVEINAIPPPDNGTATEVEGPAPAAAWRSKESSGGGGGGGRGGDGGRGSSAWGVYCDGPLLEAVQSARLFADSKTFVDMPMKKDPSQVLAAYNALSVVDRKDPGKLAQFVSTYFAEAGSDIMSVTPKDFSPNPSFLDGIEDGPRREWARAIHGLWPLLVRANAADVAVNPQRHSLLPRQHPVVVPGGRFRESYYWDTFWTIRGLVVSGMVDTARGAVLNLLDDVDRFGFVPNGGRLYYTERSQPPLLSDMVCEVYSARPDRAFLARALPSLEAEHAFWMNFERGRAVCVPALPPPLKTFDAMLHGVTLEGAAVLLNRYWGALDPPPAAGVGDTAGGKGVTGPLLSRPPRPESFREDTEVSLEQQHQCCCGGGNSCASDAVRGCKSYSGGEDRDRPADAGDIAGDVASGAATSGTPGAVDSDSAGIADHEAAGLSGACHELAAAAESGWDFSSRWAGLSSRGRSASTAASSGDRDKSTSSMEGEDGEDEEEGDAFRLSATATTSVVPVDLNAFLHRVELNIARLHHALAGNPTDRKEPASSETPDDPTPPTMPPLLSLDEIQRRFLSRRRGSTKSWSSMSSTLMEKLTRQGELEFGSEEADMTSPTASGGGDGRLGLESRALSRKVMLFAAAARARAKAMEQTMWDGRSALWRDLLLPTGEQSPSITPACFVPMWAGLPWPVLDDDEDSGIAESAHRLGRSVEALRSSGLVQPGGVRTSLEDSGQQWDGRNAWPPLQWMIIQGLRNSASALTPPANATKSAAATTAGAATATATQAARQLASEVEEAFLDGALAGWDTTGAMMEKYDADEVGKGGGGGEYNLQVGFGWTNGVALDLIAGKSKRPTHL